MPRTIATTAAGAVITFGMIRLRRSTTATGMRIATITAPRTALEVDIGGRVYARGTRTELSWSRCAGYLYTANVNLANDPSAVSDLLGVLNPTDAGQGLSNLRSAIRTYGTQPIQPFRQQQSSPTAENLPEVTAGWAAHSGGSGGSAPATTISGTAAAGFSAFTAAHCGLAVPSGQCTGSAELRPS